MADGVPARDDIVLLLRIAVSDPDSRCRTAALTAFAALPSSSAESGPPQRARWGRRLAYLYFGHPRLRVTWSATRGGDHG